MKEIKLDDKIIEKKNIINELESKIDFEKKKLNDIANQEEYLGAIKRNINDTVNTLNLAIKGERMNMIVDDLYRNSQTAFRNEFFKIDEEKESLRKNINNLLDEKNYEYDELKKIYENKEKEHKDNA